MKRRLKRRFGGIVLALLCMFSLCACEVYVQEVEEMHAETLEKESVVVRYLDMGQGNASLVESDGQYMLIDTGNYVDVDRLRSYLEEAGVERLEYVVGTHPHADHIGSLATIIREYEIGTLLMPDVEMNTKTYRVAVEAAEKKELPITNPVPGDRYELGDVEFQILSPHGSEYEELNDYSISVRLSCQDIDFLWTGDATMVSEAEMIESGLPLEAEIYHVGHHGSYSSSGAAFLKEVDPLYAVISCGKDNEYGYPHREVMERLEAVGAEVFVTAESGTIMMTCSGNDLSMRRE